MIEVLSGGRRGLLKECYEEKLSLGRRAGNDLSFDGKEDRAVSGQHTCLELRQGIWWAEDLNSTNGTLLNGEVLSQAHPLESGDELELGRRPDMGTGGTVRLRLTMQNPTTAGGIDDDLDFEPTRLRTDDPEPSKSGDEAETAQFPPKTEAVVDRLPASSVAERLASLQARTLDLGKVSYQLDEQLIALTRQAMEAPAIDLASLPGGTAFLEGQAAQARWAEECATARIALEGHAAAADAELNVLDERCQERAAELATSELSGEEARARSEQAAQQESSLQAQTRSTLAPLLADLNRALEGPSFPKQAPIAAWIESLQEAATELDSRSASLSSNSADALAACEQAKSTAAAAAAARSAASEASVQRLAAEAHQAEALQQLQQRLEQLESQPEALPGHEQAQLITFASTNLASSPSPLGELPAYDIARRLEQQRATLTAEIERIQAELQ